MVIQPRYFAIDCTNITNTWSIESRSLKVTVLGILMVSKSTVIPKGTDISSVLAYRRPMDPEESSTFTKKLIDYSLYK